MRTTEQAPLQALTSNPHYQGTLGMVTGVEPKVVNVLVEASQIPLYSTHAQTRPHRHPLGAKVPNEGSASVTNDDTDDIQ